MYLIMVHSSRLAPKSTSIDISQRKNTIEA